MSLWHLSFSSLFLSCLFTLELQSKKFLFFLLCVVLSSFFVLFCSVFRFCMNSIHGCIRYLFHPKQAMHASRDPSSCSFPSLTVWSLFVGCFFTRYHFCLFWYIISCKPGLTSLVHYYEPLAEKVTIRKTQTYTKLFMQLLTWNFLLSCLSSNLSIFFSPDALDFWDGSDVTKSAGNIVKSRTCPVIRTGQSLLRVKR